MKTTSSFPQTHPPALQPPRRPREPFPADRPDALENARTGAGVCCTAQGGKRARWKGGAAGERKRRPEAREQGGRGEVQSPHAGDRSGREFSVLWVFFVQHLVLWVF